VRVTCGQGEVTLSFWILIRMKLEAGRLRLSASDVANFLACGHLTRLDMLTAQGQLRPPHQYDAGFQDLVARGEAHERVVLDGFAARGWSISEIATASDGDAAQATVAAVKAGADVVYQGVLRAQPGDGPSRSWLTSSANDGGGFPACTRTTTTTTTITSRRRWIT
jgi:hypothetical protein